MFRRALTLVVLAGVLLGPGAGAEEPGERPAGLRIVNVVDDFLAYHAECRASDEARRLSMWDEMLEARHAAFFRDAIYRGLEGEERDAYERDCVRRFWSEVAPGIDALRRRAKKVAARLAEVAKRFREVLPEADLRGDVYLTVSFSFKGKVQEVDGRNVLALGIEQFEDEGAGPSITIAHELVHLVHLRRFPRRGALYRALWTEGLAVYGSALVVPGHRRSAYLGFDAAKMNLCEERLPELAADLRQAMGENDQRRKRLYFGAEVNDTQVPPESGYYVGLLVAEHMAKSRPLADLLVLPPEQVFGLLRAELDRLARR